MINWIVALMIVGLIAYMTYLALLAWAVSSDKRCDRAIAIIHKIKGRR